MLSLINNNKPPLKKPKKVINHAFKFKFSAISMAGESRDQNEAAIITPAAKPNIPSIIVLLIFLKKKTTDAPRAVTPQVNNVANKANTTGDKFSIFSTIKSPFFFLFS